MGIWVRSTVAVVDTDIYSALYIDPRRSLRTAAGLVAIDLTDPEMDQCGERPNRDFEPEPHTLSPVLRAQSGWLWFTVGG